MKLLPAAVSIFSILVTTAASAQSLDDDLITGLWALTSQKNPVTLDDVASRLRVNVTDFRDSAWAYSHLGWQHVLILEMERTNPEPTTSNPVRGVWLTSMLRDIRLERYRQSGKPFEQVVRVYLRTIHASPLIS